MTPSAARESTADLARSHVDIPLKQPRGARLAELSAARFRLLLLAIVAAASAMAAEGVQSFAELAGRNAVSRARRNATSPISYRTMLPALHALAPAADGRVRVLVRADSAGAGAEALCGLAAAAGRADVRWVALSPAVEPCISTAAGAALVRAGAPAAGELAGARWVILDAGGAALYSGRAVPSAQRLATTAALLTPAGPEPRP
jgi:hypothetical protein